MHGQNFFINQPLAIDKAFLLSLIPTLIQGFQQKNFLSAEKIVETAQNKIQAQMSASISEGASKFPVVLDVIGPIVKYSDYYYLGTKDMISILKRLDSSENVSGIVLNIDSGGGMVSGTANLVNTIKNLEKPTIAFTDGLMCSSALDIASGADFRMASPHADLIGSIGTMLSYQDFSKLFEKYGAVIYELYAPQSSEKNAEWRALESGDSALYEERLNYLSGEFINRIKANYGEKLQDDGHVFKGKVYTPDEALAIGLIDELGTLEDALAKF